MILFAAFVADLVFGDPIYPYHPVRLMGKAIERGEVWLRARIPDARIAGAVLAVGLPIFVFTAASMLLIFLSAIHPGLAALAAIFGIYSSLSIHDLRKEAERIYASLKNGDLQAARENTARIVGRETAALDEAEITRACVESIAENSVDGIVAPLFFAALGGAPLALAYKAVNTLDSMIGHKNERYFHFGFWAARQDHWINWIPARLAYGLIGLAVFFVNGRMKEAFEAGKPYVSNPACGNSPIPEAAFAGALGIQLGGENHYQGRVVHAPLVGKALRPLTKEVIPDSLKLMMAEAWWALGACLLIAAVI